MEFITKLNGSSILDYGLSKEFSELQGLDYETVTKAQVEWSFYVDARTWGIKDISAYTTNVVINMDISIYSEGEIVKVKSIEIDSSKGEWEVENNILDLLLSDSVCPQDVEVDFENKIITVNY